MDYMSKRYGTYLNFSQTNETFGVVEMPQILSNEIDIKPIEHKIEKIKITKNRIMELASLPMVTVLEIGYSMNKFKYKFLSNCQGTLYAVTALHTKEKVSCLRIC